MPQWAATPFSRGSSWPRDWSHISCIGRRVLYHWATWEALTVLSWKPTEVAPFHLTMTLLSQLEQNDFDDHLATFCFLTIQVQILQMVKSVTYSSNTRVYGDASIFTNSDPWLSGWEDVGKVQPFWTNLQKNVYSLSSDECVGLPFFFFLIVTKLLFWQQYPGCITSRFYELYSISLISLNQQSMVIPFSNNTPSYLQILGEAWGRLGNCQGVLGSNPRLVTY